MARAPFEHSALDLGPELFDRAILFLMLLEEGFEAGKVLVQVWIDPVTILKLANERISIDVAHMLLAARHAFQVVDKLKEDADNLLFVMEVKDLGALLKDLQAEVLEKVKARVLGFIMERKDPQCAEGLVSDLRILLALVGQEVGKEVKGTGDADEAVSQIILLENSHECKAEGDVGQVTLILCPNQHGEELLGGLLGLFAVEDGKVGLSEVVKKLGYLLDEEGEDVRGDVSVWLALLRCGVEIDEVEQNPHKIHRMINIVHDLEVVANTVPRVFENAVKVSERVKHEIKVTLDLLDNREEDADDVGCGLLVIRIVE